MNLLFKIHIFYYTCLFLFVYLIPNPTKDSDIFKFILLFLSLGLMYVVALFYGLLAFDKKYLSEKRFSYFILGAIFIELNLFLSLGHLVYAKFENIYILYTILAILFIITTSILLKIRGSLKKKDFQPWKEAKLLVKFGDTLENTPIMNAITKIDRMFIAFCISVGMAGKFYIFATVVVIILIFSINYLRILKNEFLKSGLITIKETYFAIIFYYFCYILSIVWGYYIPNFSIIMIGGAGILFIKLYIHRIALKVYEEKNDLIEKNNCSI